MTDQRDNSGPDAADYIKALEAALPQSKAEVAAAYERAAERTANDAKMYWENGMASASAALDNAAAAIRALATPDQTSALDAVRAEAREQGMREAAYIAFNACLVLPDGGNPTEEERLVCDEAYNRILAAIKGGKT